MLKGYRGFGKLKGIAIILFMGFMTLSLFACGSGGGGGNSKSDTTTPSILTGIAATGAPMSGGSVYLKEANGTEHGPYPIDHNGRYSIDVTGFTPPFYLRAERITGGQTTILYSVSMGAGTANINPLTDLAIAAAGIVNDPADVYNNPVIHPIAQGALNKAINDILALMASVLNNPKYNASSSNFLTDGNYKADHKGLDGVFDDLSLEIKITPGVVMIKLNGKPIGQVQLNDLANSNNVIKAADVQAALGASASGEGYNYPVSRVSGEGYYDQQGFRASMVLDADLASLGTSSLSYSFNRIALASTSITGVSVTGSTATITGTATDSGAAGCTFTATVSDSPDAMGIVINPGGACTTSYSSGAQAISGGTGYVFEPSPFRASMVLDAHSGSLGTSSLSYSFNRIALASTSITGVSLTGSTATITGTATDSGAAGCTFTATVSDSPDAMGIVINPGGACTTSYSSGAQAISGGTGYWVR